MGQAQSNQDSGFNFQAGVDRLDPEQAESMYQCPIPSSSKSSSMKTTKQIMLENALHREWYYEPQFNGQIIAPTEIATSMITKEEIGDAIAATFNWIMGNKEIFIFLFLFTHVFLFFWTRTPFE